MNEKFQRIKIWDSFIRIYHWLMVAAVAGLWWTGEEGRMDLHQDIAIALAALLITRVGWGFFGSENVRFSAFVTSPKRVLSHLGARYLANAMSQAIHIAQQALIRFYYCC